MTIIISGSHTSHTSHMWMKIFICVHTRHTLTYTFTLRFSFYFPKCFLIS
ncbi:hypothetical protein RchiOBHm_Chr2g0167191 [Rosa chinensis]|uniref:Uncharacterized protein n=1 Tax=Rosa chinensis TaxID=74649 RepID=A0A2P6S497_ROSCH|nr:hypothetical protein RchiOBHm_Chr2g0167181 [Rosa chinensis]PRQ53500.1 hypothetical protein RchiOBHm_Chr2g0167191 [Rosa chinensis]